MALHWVRLPGAEDCIAGDALAREVERKLQRPVFPAARDSEVLIEGHVQRGPEGYRAQLQMSRGDGPQLGSRVLTSKADNCRELSETLSVVLAVMIDPEAEGHVRPLEPAKPPPPAPAKPQPVAADNHVLAFGRMLIGVVPAASVGFGAAYERALGAAGGLRVEGVSFFERRSRELYREAGDIGEAAVDLSLAYAGAAYCPLWLGPARVRLSGCAGIELGIMRANGAKVTASKDANHLWLSGSAALRLSVRIVARLELQAAASFVGAAEHIYYVVVRRNGADTDDTRRAGRGGNFGAAFDFGLGARF